MIRYFVETATINLNNRDNKINLTLTVLFFLMFHLLKTFKIYTIVVEAATLSGAVIYRLIP